MNQPIEKAGRMRVGKNYRNIYKTVAPIECGHCSRKIEPGELVTRGSTKEFAYSCLLCADCRAVIINTKQNNINPLTKFIESEKWFDDRNGNSLQLIQEIVSACGYEHFKFDDRFSDRFANMVYASIRNNKKFPKDRRRGLAKKFLRLVAESKDNLYEVKSELQRTFEETFMEKERSKS